MDGSHTALYEKGQFKHGGMAGKNVQCLLCYECGSEGFGECLNSSTVQREGWQVNVQTMGELV